MITPTRPYKVVADAHFVVLDIENEFKISFNKNLKSPDRKNGDRAPLSKLNGTFMSPRRMPNGANLNTLGDDFKSYFFANHRNNVRGARGGGGIGIGVYSFA